MESSQQQHGTLRKDFSVNVGYMARPQQDFVVLDELHRSPGSLTTAPLRTTTHSGSGAAQLCVHRGRTAVH